MPAFQIKEVFPYELEALYQVALDGKRYPEISSWIKAVRVKEEGHTVTIDARIQAPSLPFAMNYSCCLEKVSDCKIIARASKCSPFKSFGGALDFKTLPDGHTEITCSLQYERSLNPLSLIPVHMMESIVKDAVKDVLRPYLARTLPPVEPKTAATNPPPTFRPL